MNSVALLGGAFNPPHLGHLLAAVFAKATWGFDEVWLMPAFHHPFDKKMELFDHRLAMCQLLTWSLESWLKVTDIERQIGGTGRTIETLEYLLPKYPHTRFSLLVGSDIEGDVPKWKSWDRISQMVDVRIIARAGFPSSAAVGPGLIEISSTEVRSRLQGGEEMTGWVPQKVMEYCRTHALYASK